MSSSEKISRRSFAALAALSAVLPAAAHTPTRASVMKHRLIKPPRLRFGDTIGLIAPGGYTDDEAIARAVTKIEQLGFRVRLGEHLREVYGNYAGSVGQRLADLHGMFADSEVKALWCIRGGSGCISLLSSIDYRLLRANPKILIGYSDITALHLAIYRHAGLVTFHGPVAGSGMSVYSNGHMLNVLMDPQAEYTIRMAPENAERALAEPHFGIRTAVHGQASGRLIGGNLSMVAALAGTPYAADFRKRLLFLEEVNEAPYRIERWLTQLDLAVGLEQAAGVMIGICDNCVPDEGEHSLTLHETLDMHLKRLSTAAVSGYSFGHIRHQFTLPIGINARLDTLRQTVTLLEAAVS
ncbi:LD-carboxypeptidase [Massilia sp. PAMC28688]|uniref:S66 peptidase family protein n=1 Tax=Massilia sp. PAMC28688 TaxID=2861283 RepID=UPI001C635CFC|nr:LD-carboxypeptidase [Massilia sp. PAMC28688]QYF95301.1 LD-carboxypeptidase [Massilia sp. PAMC28688]